MKLRASRVPPVQLWQLALAKRQNDTLRDQAIALAAYGHGGTTIARALGVSRGVIAGYLRSHVEGRPERPLTQKRWAHRLKRGNAA